MLEITNKIIFGQGILYVSKKVYYTSNNNILYKKVILERVQVLYKERNYNNYFWVINIIKQLNTSFSNSVSLLAARPFGVSHASTSNTRTVDVTNTANKSTILCKHPSDLYVLWEEYNVGIRGSKPAREFTSRERALNRTLYSFRKVFWDAVDTLFRGGLLSQCAIDNAYEVYGKNKSPKQII